MAWLYVPASADSNSDSGSRSDTDINVWVMSSGTPMQRPLSWRGWKTRPWIRRLSGTISKPSMAARSADSWISSLRATRANHSPAQVSDVAKTIRDTYGRTFDVLCRKYSPDFVSSRTSQTTFDWAMKPSTKTFENLATRLRQESTARLKWARATSENDSSYWPTARASANENRTTKPPPSQRTTRTLAGEATGWATPRQNESGCFQRDSGIKGRERPTLTGQTKAFQTPNWMTPSAFAETAEKCGKPDRGRTAKSSGRTLTGQTLELYGLGPHANSGPPSFPPTQKTSHRGPKYTVLTLGLPRLYRMLLHLKWFRARITRRLNPSFVEWLMNFPSGWTACGRSVTPSYLLWLQRHSAALSLELQHETDRIEHAGPHHTQIP